jgi:hypothetical protein
MALAFVAAALYLASLFLPALTFESREPLPGYHVLLWGWWGLFAESLAWFANPLLFIAGLKFLRGRFGLSLVWGFVAANFSVTSFFAKEWCFSEAAGTRITGLGMGFHVWCASLVAVVLAFAQRRES